MGSIITSIKKGKKVIAVPRKHEYEEHVNDHQKDIVELFNQKGYILGIENVEELEQALNQIKNFTPKNYVHNNEKMIGIIAEFIDKL